MTWREAKIGLPGHRGLEASSLCRAAAAADLQLFLSAGVSGLTKNVRSACTAHVAGQGFISQIRKPRSCR
jgi:hypothetical protein